MPTRTVAPKFQVVPDRDTIKAQPARRERRSWQAVIEALVAGQTLFMPDSELTDIDVKYLQLALARRGNGERLTTLRRALAGQPGRQLRVVT